MGLACRYQIQRYEGASTIFGPHTHQAYVNQYEALAAALVTNTPYPAGPSPPSECASSGCLHTHPLCVLWGIGEGEEGVGGLLSSSSSCGWLPLADIV